MSSPDLIGGSHHKEFRIPYRDPRVKPEDDIVGNSRIPKENSLKENPRTPKKTNKKTKKKTK